MKVLYKYFWNYNDLKVGRLCGAGKMDEYSQIEQTFSPIAMKEITDWVLEHLK